MIERSAPPERAWVMAVDLGTPEAAAAQEELVALVESSGANIVGTTMLRRSRPDPATYFGQGQVERLKEGLEAQPADVLVVGVSLTPIQQRNLEEALRVRVIDRTALILDIFAQRAQSHEGKLQVELAQLKYLASRLVRAWTHLERQRGGIGLRGPGETQLETDRRLIARRIQVLERRLEQLARQRATRRRGRERRGAKQVSLVGYTNAGKSTLFNALTKAGTYAADQLFATLDTTSRRLWLPRSGNVILSDTVGFIRDLPHTLVAAFHATLEEVIEADLLLLVRDAASPDGEAQREAVLSVLAEIGAAGVPRLEVMNKIDLTGVEPQVVRDAYGTIQRVYVSAATGQGLPLLREAIDERLAALAAPHDPVQGENEVHAPQHCVLLEGKEPYVAQ